jgi:hypothetical protein
MLNADEDQRRKTNPNFTLWTKKGTETGHPIHQPTSQVQDLFKRALQYLAVRRYTF